MDANSRIAPDTRLEPWPSIGAQIQAATGRKFSASSVHSISGGCINAAYKFGDRDRCYFVKLNRPERVAMFAAEAQGLRELSAAVRVPAPVCWGRTQHASYLVLEYLELQSLDGNGCAKLGSQLAQMHRTVRPYYGWDTDNTIGSTAQINTHSDNWIYFWRTHRLGYQLLLAAHNGYGGDLQRLGERVLADMNGFFTSYTPTAALLHGDLWGGNSAMDTSGAPVLFDPAVYYGDRETDLAMTELFGGFSASLYAAYRESYALDSGYRVRKDLYNLYHLLNHLNLFGASYLAQAESVLARLLSELR